MKEVFTSIVENGGWSKHPCGPGSTLEYTEYLRKNLPAFLKKHGIRSMLDLPCGDYSWMSRVSHGIDYIGADIVDSLINNARKQYPGVDFRVLDITEDKLPKVDLLFCRDCLLHLSFKDIDRALLNIANSDIKYVLMSNWYEFTENNRDIENGKYRLINFLDKPYSFGEPIDSINDYIAGFPERKMLLWDIQKSIKPYVKKLK